MTTTITTTDRKALACNYAEGSGVARPGALAYVVCSHLGGNLPERVKVLARSRGGRWVEKWEAVKRLSNFRLKTLPPEHPRYDDERITGATGEDLRRMLWARADQAWEAES
jgi:hypothetical protein